MRTPARLLENLERWHQTLPATIRETLEDTIGGLERAHGPAIASEMGPAPALGDPLPLRITIERAAGQTGGVVRAEMVAGRGLWLWSIRQLLTSAIRELHRHRWTILAPPDGTEWITSDDPVLRVNFNSLSDYTFTGGWGSPGTDLVLPLGPRHLLYTQVSRPVPTRGTSMPPDKAAVIQQLTAAHAHRLIFASTPDPSVAQLRPRIVDPGLIRSDAAQWARWHNEQTLAERELLAGQIGEPRPPMTG